MFNFNKPLTDETGFPSKPGSGQAARAQFMVLFNELKDAINGVVENKTAPVFVSTVPTGVSPLTVASTTKVANLNADKLDDKEASDFAQILNGAGNKIQFGNSSGLVVTSDVAVTVVINFPIPFLTPPPFVVGIVSMASTTYGGYMNVLCIATTTTSATFKVDSSIPQTIFFKWVAIGTTA